MDVQNVTESIMRFKRSQRSLAFNNPIRSIDPTKTPLEECTTHYANLYASDESRPQTERQCRDPSERDIKTRV